MHLKVTDQGAVPRFPPTTKHLWCAGTALGAQGIWSGEGSSVENIPFGSKLAETSIRDIHNVVTSSSSSNCLSKKIKTATMVSGQISLCFSEAFDSPIKSDLKA